MLDFLNGYKTYIAAAGLALLGLVDFANGDKAAAMVKWSQALGLFGLRHAITKASAPKG